MRSFLVVAGLAAALSACGGGSGGGGTQSTIGAGSTFSGTLSDGALLKVTLTKPAALRSIEVAAVATWPFSITGTITPVGGAPLDVTGGFDPDGKAFMLSGGGYTISGSFAGNALTATGTSPSGTVTLAAYRSDDAAVTVYCGTWQTLESLEAFQASFSLVFRGDGIKGVTAQPSKPLTLTGTLSGTSFVVYPDGGSGNMSGTVTGTGSSSTIAGIVSGKVEGSDVYGQVGTFSGAVCQ